MSIDRSNLAFDRSARQFDPDGRMRVDVTHISKAMVCPYLGSEIPSADALGLDSDKIYMLLRDPVELTKAAPSFNNLPLLIQHVPVSADEPRRDLTVGTTGSDAAFNSPYLSVSLAVWDAIAIAGIESKQQTELSSAYRYRADMTSGVYEGTAYDGVMRDIVGNHVALVDVGRAGPDVVVADGNPFKGNIEMSKKQRVAAAKAGARVALAGLIAQDAALAAVNLAALDLVIDSLAMDADPDDEKANKEPVAKDGDEDESGDDYEDDPDNAGKRRKKVKAAADADEPKPPEVTKAAMDAAIAKAVSTATKQAKADMEALHTARKDVAHMVGEVAMDSAEAVYKFALDHAKIDVAGVHPSAFGALVRMASSQKEVPVAIIGMDSAAAKTVTEKFPQLNRFK